LVIIMFRTRKQWQEFNAALFKNKETDVAAYYSVISNRVIMYEQSDLVDMAPELALKEAISTIAHEGVHQILHNIGVQRRLSRWPMWISEGLPEYFAPTSIDKGVRWKGVGLVNDLRMKSIDAFLKKQPSMNPGEMVKTTVRASSLTATGYAFAWGLTHFLAERRKEKFFDYLAEVSQIGPLEKAAGPTSSSGSEAPSDVSPQALKNEELFVKHFGADFPGLEREMLTHLQALPYVDPIEAMTHYVCMLRYQQGALQRRSAMVTFSPAMVKRWQEEAVGGLAPSIQATAAFDVQVFPNKATAMDFANEFAQGGP
jgi:uncharacterized protein DUF1570